MNELAVSIAIVLFPGLISTVICDKIAIHGRDWRTFKYGVYSFIFGVLSYAIVQLLLSAWQIADFVLVGTPVLFTRLRVWSLASTQHADIALWEVCAASAVAPIIAFVATTISEHKWLTRLAQRLHVSNKFGDENLFSYYLNSDEVQNVYIRDPNVNQTYAGRVLEYSETDHIQEVVLSGVTVYDYEGSQPLYSLPTMYLARPIGTFTIETVE